MPIEATCRATLAIMVGIAEAALEKQDKLILVYMVKIFKKINKMNIQIHNIGYIPITLMIRIEKCYCDTLNRFYSSVFVIVYINLLVKTRLSSHRLKMNVC